MLGEPDFGFPSEGFSWPLATKRSDLKLHKQNGCQLATHGSIGDSWPMAMSGYPRRPRVDCETRWHAEPNDLVETRPRTQSVPEPDSPSPGRTNSGMKRRQPQTLKLFVVSDI